MARFGAFLVPLMLLASCSQTPRAPADVAPRRLRAVAPVPVSADPEIAAVYAGRAQRALWTAGEAGERLLAMLRRAASDGLDPARYRVDEIEAALRVGDPQSLARADLILSESLVAYARDLRTPSPALRVTYAEPGLAPAAPSAAEALRAGAAVRRINPVYDGLRDGLEDYRRRWSSLPQVRLGAAPGAAALRRRLGLSPGGFDAALAAALAAFKRAHGLPADSQLDAATLAALNRPPSVYENIIRLNMERARAIPRIDGRFVLVDAAAARLWMFEGARAADHMRVVVGKPGMSTPLLAARLRYAVLNPYWNVPVDLARERARQVLRRGTAVLRAERLQILSQFHAEDRVLSPSSVDWRAVAAGREPLRLRQLPGGANMMGAIKFMMPNGLDIYLHDFPDRSLFARADRRISSGCVRLEDSGRLARWLFGGTAPQPDGPRAEQRVELPAPVPVYITYLTAVPDNGRIAFQRDPDNRDPALLAALERQRQGGA